MMPFPEIKKSRGTVLVAFFEAVFPGMRVARAGARALRERRRIAATRARAALHPSFARVPAV